jgi:hypothetical protein
MRSLTTEFAVTSEPATGTVETTRPEGTVFEQVWPTFGLGDSPCRVKLEPAATWVKPFTELSGYFELADKT